MRLGLARAAAAIAVFASGPHANAHEHMRHDMQMQIGAPTDASIFNLESKWTTEEGASVPIASLGGRPVVATMGYTSCKDICPAIVADMTWIEKHLPAGAAGNVRFAFFSIDSAVDTPARLKAYADGRALSTAWTLYHGDEHAVRELAAAFGIGYRTDGQGGFDHAAVISLLNEKGEIVFQQRGTKAESDALLAKLKGLLAKP